MTNYCVFICQSITFHVFQQARLTGPSVRPVSSSSPARCPQKQQLAKTRPAQEARTTRHSIARAVSAGGRKRSGGTIESGLQLNGRYMGGAVFVNPPYARSCVETYASQFE